MFSQTAQFYDTIYAFKDYRAESERVRDFVLAVQPEASTLLDVACGTGKHLEVLREWFDCAGVDLDPHLLDIARARLPGVPLEQGDFCDLRLGRRFDAITCLFSSIGYAGSVQALRSAAERLASHLNPGGVLLVEPWLTPDTFVPNTVHSMRIEQPDLQICRMNTSLVQGRDSVMDLHYLIGTPEGVQHRVERHVLTLFTRREMEDALRSAGLDVSYDETGLIGRGLYIAQRPD